MTITVQLMGYITLTPDSECYVWGSLDETLKHRGGMRVLYPIHVTHSPHLDVVVYSSARPCVLPTVTNF